MEFSGIFRTFAAATKASMTEAGKKNTERSLRPRKFYALSTGVSTMRPLELTAKTLADEGIQFRYTKILKITEAVALVVKTCARHVHSGSTMLDLGCGVGNFTLRVLQEVGGLNSHLVDLSRPMLARAEDRLRQSNSASVVTHQSDLRILSFADNSFDVILAGAVLHHLRDEEDWRSAFTRFHGWLKPSGRISSRICAPSICPMCKRSCGDATETTSSG